MPTVGQASRTTISHPHAGNCPVKPKSTLHPKIIYCRCTIAPLPKQHNTSEASNAWAGSSFIIPIQPKPQKPPPPHQSHPNTTPKPNSSQATPNYRPRSNTHQLEHDYSLSRSKDGNHIASITKKPLSPRPTSVSSLQTTFTLDQPESTS